MRNVCPVCGGPTQLQTATFEQDCSICNRIAALEQQLAALRESEKFYHIRCDELQIIQSRMRDPERQMVCDILANGKPRDKAGIGDYALLQGEGNES